MFAQTDINPVPEVHQFFFEDLLNTKVVNMFTETLFGQQISSLQDGRRTENMRKHEIIRAYWIENSK